MSRYVIVPDGWPTTLAECPPGPFVWECAKERFLGFKSEYKTPEGKIEAYNSAGEFFCAGAVTESERGMVIVQPVIMVLKEYGA